MTDINTLWEENSLQRSQKYIEPEELNTLKDNEINILSQNVRSLKRNGSKLRAMLLKASYIDLIFLQEVWSPKIPIIIKGFKLEILKRTSKRGGGLGVYVKENTDYKILEEKITNHWEVQILGLKTKQKEIIFVNTYIPSKLHGKTALAEITEFCNKYRDNENLVFLGDFNQNLLSNKEAIGINYFALKNGCTLLSSLPTRVTKNKQSCLDLILVRTTFSYDSNVVITDISDHFTPTLTIKTEKEKTKPKPRIHRVLNKSTLSLIEQQLSEIDWNQYDGLSHEDFTNKIQSILINSLNEHAPYVEVKGNVRKTQDWFTEGLKVSRKNKQKLLKQWLSSKKKNLDGENASNLAYLKYKEYKNIYYALVQKAKDEHTVNSIKVANARTKWKICNGILGRNKNEKNHLPDKFAYKNDHNDVVFAQNDQDIANNFNKYFVSVAESIIKDLPKPKTNHLEYLKAQT